MTDSVTGDWVSEWVSEWLVTEWVSQTQSESKSVNWLVIERLEWLIQRLIELPVVTLTLWVWLIRLKRLYIPMGISY